MLRPTSWFLALFFPFFIYGYTFSSDTIDFDGTQIDLHGHVELNHTHFSLLADRAFLLQNSPNFDPKKITLKNNVVIKLGNQGLIESETAEFDFIEKSGRLFSSTAPIHFLASLSRHNLFHSLEASCLNADFDLDQDESQQPYMKNLHLYNGLTIRLDHLYQLSADEASFQFQTNSPEFIPDSIYLSGKEHPLFFSFPNGFIKTDHLHVLFTKESLSLGKTEGSMTYRDRINFNSDAVTYHHERRSLFIKGPTTIYHEDEWQLKTEQGLLFQSFDLTDPFQFRHLEILAPFEFRYQEHRFESLSNCQLDQFKQTVTLSNSTTAPFSYHHPLFDLEAHNLKICYDSNPKAIESIRFSNSVRIKMAQPFEGIQSVCCDKLIFYPKELRIEGCADSGKKLLFYSEKNELLITAEKIDLFFTEDRMIKRVEFDGTIKSKISPDVPYLKIGTN